MATARNGDVKSAYNGMQEMKNHGISLNKYHYFSLIRTYSNAVRHSETTEKMIEAYIRDSWALYKQASDQGIVESHLLDSLLQVHVNSGRIGEMEGAVLPLYK